MKRLHYMTIACCLFFALTAVEHCLADLADPGLVPEVEDKDRKDREDKGWKDKDWKDKKERDAPEVVEVTVGSDIFSRKIDEDEVETQRDIEIEIRRSRTFKRSVTITSAARVRAGLDAVIAEIEGELEASLRLDFGVTETVEKTVRVSGDKTRVKLIWFEKYQKGAATVRIGKREAKVPFEFPVGLGLKKE